MFTVASYISLIQSRLRTGTRPSVKLSKTYVLKTTTAELRRYTTEEQLSYNTVSVGLKIT